MCPHRGFCAVSLCKDALVFIPAKPVYYGYSNQQNAPQKTAVLCDTGKGEFIMARVYNFSAGPSMLPEKVLRQAQAELLEYGDSGQSVMEMSHRSKWFDAIIKDTEATLRRVMNIPDNYKVGFFQGGATQQFAMVPLNFMTTGKADYLVTGNFSNLAAKEAAKFGEVNIVASSKDKNFTYIRGVNDIEVEVTEKKESRPGYEGNVIVSEIKPHELDAHYDRVLITLNRAQVPRLTWGVQTPYDKAVYKGDFTDANPPGTSSGTGESSTGSGISDYRWIKFAINEDYGRGNNEYVKYPGDQNYKGLPGGGEKSGYDGHSGYPNARLLDVHQLLQRLRDDYDKGLTSGTVTITAFIDEYVYVRHPWDHDYSAGNNYQLKKWREYVGAEDRLLYIIDGDNAHYSPDGASSTMTAIQTFRQKSIRTVYNVDKSESELPTCWGLESSMEGDLVDVGDVSRGKSSGNGRLNTLQCLLGSNYQTVLQWTDVLDVWSTNPEDRYKLKINDALHAVLTRNRDLDGDNIVDPEEIRWYLAAKDQLVDFYIGESALDDASHLYPTNPDDRDGQTYWHYTTSTAYDGGQGGNNVAWGLYAEECVALGATSGMERPELGNKFTYRCVRNLGIGLAALEKREPVALIPRVTAAEADGTYVIDCSNLSPKARRQSIETGNLPQHNDLSPYNRPYAKFRVATRDQDFENAGRERTWSIPAFRWRRLVGVSDYDNHAIGIPHTQSARTADYANPPA